MIVDELKSYKRYIIKVCMLLGDLCLRNLIQVVIILIQVLFCKNVEELLRKMRINDTLNPKVKIQIQYVFRC